MTFTTSGSAAINLALPEATLDTDRQFTQERPAIDLQYRSSEPFKLT